MITDNTRLRETLTRGLNRHKFEVLAAANQAEAEALTRAPASQPAKVHVLLLDVPDGAASVAARTLNGILASGLDVPVVAIAAPGDHGVLEMSPATRKATVLIKPIDLAELAAELARLGGRER